MSYNTSDRLDKIETRRDELKHQSTINSSERVATALGIIMMPGVAGYLIWSNTPNISTGFRLAAIALVGAATVEVGRRIYRYLAKKDQKLRNEMALLPKPPKPSPLRFGRGTHHPHNA